MSGRRYDLLAVDLDGTLLNSRGGVSAATVEAVARARGAGLHVTVCTGRGLEECSGILYSIGQRDPVVVTGGAQVADPVTGRTLHRVPMRPGVASKAVRRILADGHAALVRKDGDSAGVDYLVVSERGADGLDPATRWWFGVFGIRVGYVARLEDDPHPEHTIRVGVVATGRDVARLHDDLSTALDGEAVLHRLQGLPVPEGILDDPATSITIIEAFDVRATKWDGVRRIADGLGVARERIAAIGDQENDLSMLRGAGLGIAMANAVPEVKAVAGRHTLGCDEDGVAHAIDRILAGEW